MTIQTIQRYPTIAVLVIANLIPLFGVIFLDWSLFSIMFLYWLESGIIGFFSILRLLLTAKWQAIFLVPFFIFHFGIFLVVHLVFIFAIFGIGEIEPITLGQDSFFLLIERLPVSFFYSAISLFISHGISFFVNFVIRQEYKRVNKKYQIELPYDRIAVMHFTLVFGAILLSVFGTPVVPLALFVLLKIGLDVASHYYAHKRLQAA